MYSLPENVINTVAAPRGGDWEGLVPLNQKADKTVKEK